MRNRRTTEPSNLSTPVVLGIVVPFVTQGFLTWPVVWLGHKYGWDVAAPLLIGFLITSSLGFMTVTTRTSLLNRLLIGVLYFPLMFVASLYVAMFAAQAVGAKGNF